MTENVNTDTFGANVPSRNLSFPAANITAVELIVFLPHSLKSEQVIHRLISNGGTRLTISGIANAHRRYKDNEWSPNACGTMLSKAMRNAGYKGWAITKHKTFFDKQENWDEESINVTGYKTPAESYLSATTKAVPPITFTKLAADVKKFPHGDDALDLTRMVHYAVEHFEERWTYPTDYQRLLEKVGAEDVQLKHSDRKAFERWDIAVTTLPKPLHPDLENPLEVRVKRGRPRKSKFDIMVSIDGNKEEEVGHGHPDTDADLRIGEEDVLSADELESYEREPPIFVVPPIGNEIPSVEDVVRTYLETGNNTELNPFSPYAFDGPRKAPPHRPLHCISAPKSSDVSAWAENLRWAAEQNNIFGAEGWNESPAHMEEIAKERMSRLWVSDEWLENHEQEKNKVEEDKKEISYKGVFRKTKYNWEEDSTYLGGHWCCCGTCFDCYHTTGSRRGATTTD